MKLIEQIQSNGKDEKNIVPWKYSRYLLFVKYITLSKVMNLLRSLFFWFFNIETINSYPVFLRIEISRMCHVNCLYCSEPKENRFYPFEKYSTLINLLKKYIVVIQLYEIGEPLENREIIKYIEFANRNRIGTIISSNLSIQREDFFWKDLVLSGLDKMIVAIDGITSNVYKKYRRNGDLNLVMSNLKKILYYKRIHNSKIKIEWQMIDFIWNKSEQVLAKQLSFQLGCDEFRIIPNSYGKSNWSNTPHLRTKNCIFPYITFIVNVKNIIRPCPIIYNKDVSLGNLNKENFNEIWNGDEIKKIRSNKKIIHRDGCKTCKF
ncbi:MAG: SPASM domain-containing protein [Bacteroidales bacterium]|nr:SPASM domain-containing protein [Bacteroidales bacterium]MDD3664000.1 SPASM domain-containing protein [Bacteroidales bacterium]